jgi:predicted Rdx family selenoprotein
MIATYCAWLLSAAWLAIKVNGSTEPVAAT